MRRFGFDERSSWDVLLVVCGEGYLLNFLLLRGCPVFFSPDRGRGLGAGLEFLDLSWTQMRGHPLQVKSEVP